jgi:hypothetical protein
MDTHPHTGCLIEVDATPRVLALPAGTALFLVRGEVWLTEEGRSADWMLRAGMRYDTRGGPIVVSATSAHAELYPVPAAEARLSGASHLGAFLTARAMWLRDAEIERQGSRLWRWLRQLPARRRAASPAPHSVAASGIVKARAAP